jgi:hypothetical protein
MNGVSKNKCVRFLDSFFEVQACDSSLANILSMADIEDMYELTYIQGHSIAVHMDDRDLVFERREKTYIMDFSKWIVSDKKRVINVEDRESLYTHWQVCKALEVGKVHRALS